MASYPFISSLAENAENCRCVPRASKDKWFLPEDKLLELTKVPNVKQALEEANIAEDELDDLVDFVCNDRQPARRLFFILVMMTEDNLERLSLLRGLKAARLKDEALPIGFYLGNDDYKWQGYSLENPDHSERNRYPIFADPKWSRRDRVAFGTFQWNFLAPVFGVDRFRFRFADDRILPYLELPQEPVNSGHFGEVLQAKLLAAHVPNLPREVGSDGVLVALKKAKLGDQTAGIFDDEADNLEKIRHYESDHLIKPIAAYEYGQEKCLMFPWASGGNLAEYWRTHEDEATERDGLLWIFGQFVGICSALRILHDSNCRHGDLKPENILWFRDNNDGARNGTLRIADLGLTTFHEKDAHTRDRKQKQQYTNSLSGTRRYEPPEVDASRGRHEVRSRQYDIWSMGCVMLELLVWVVDGYHALVEFQQSSTPYFWEQNGALGQGLASYFVKPYVANFMKDLATRLAVTNKGSETMCQDLLGIIQNRLLVIEPPDVYRSCEGKREIARVLDAHIQKCYDRCKTEPSYLVPLRQRGEMSVHPAFEIRIDQAEDDMDAEGPRSTPNGGGGSLAVQTQEPSHQEVSGN